MRVWLVRGGRNGEREEWALEHGRAVVGFHEVGDLSATHSRDDVFTEVRRYLPNDGENRVRNFAAQLWAFRGRIAVGDLVVMPLKTRGTIAIGRVTGDYTYQADAEPGVRHTRPVKWGADDIPRSAIKQDLLYSLGAFMTVCQIKRNDAEHRFERLVATGTDPGARSGVVKAATSNGNGDEDGTSDVDTVTFDIEQQATDRLRSHIIETFAGHEMQRLVAAVLTAEGFRCTTLPLGPDGGVDVLAGTGPLGLDSPRIVVQVKTETAAVGAPVLQQLIGATQHLQADQGLLVAWGGVTKQATQMLMGNQYFRIRVWKDTDLLDAIFRTYDRLPEEIRKDLPLKRVWTLVEETG
ncbi:restriction endonuclease [Thermobifida halotolerans]|uniref:Restriction endonuclease n=1 Tax=Thermobifida halotolerans TaxID=483545 RepID=A0A399G4I2_9ACTN|nr:restriction endonuclease [Thermobifida halotolerans]UOE19809.1 restriction endonuclease [Thermobifida halotolerans]